jgi:hypothetical protein
MNKSLLSPLKLSALFVCLAMLSCKKDETDNLSRIKNYPAITLNGPSLTSINVNEAYTDPGADAILNGSTITTQVVGSVDNTTPGFYTINYRGANTEGDTVQATRVIAVVDPAVNDIDQSGTFARSSNGALSTVTKIGKGLYRVSNLGGVPLSPPSSALQPAYFAQLTPTEIEFPTQSAPSIGEVSFSGTAATFDAAGKITQFSYSVLNPGFGTAKRTFNRQ